MHTEQNQHQSWPRPKQDKGPLFSRVVRLLCLVEGYRKAEREGAEGTGDLLAPRDV